MVTWPSIWNGLINFQQSAETDFMIVYSDYVYSPDTAEILDELAQVELEFEGEALVTITDFDRLKKIYLLFDNAELLGYGSKTYSIRIGLNLILKSQSGETITIELDPDSDICRIDGAYVFYGAYDEADYIDKLWYYLGIEQWPERVYEKYPDAFRP